MAYKLTNRSERLVSLNYRSTENGKLSAGRVKLTPGTVTEISDEVFAEIENIKLFVDLNERDLIIVQEIESVEVETEDDEIDPLD